ncbi:MAG: acyclic terpene utilization AtuA family protein [Kiloniellales bacterium]
MSSSIAIGCGAGFSADRLDPACALAASGRVAYLVFECVGERTLAFGHRDRMLDPERGYNSLLKRRMRALLPICRRSGTRIVTNMGAANPRAAAAACIAVARDLQLPDLKVAFVLGDDITASLSSDWELPELGKSIGEVGRKVVGADAYLGVEHLLPAIESDADVVITGRFADPSLFMAPVVRHYGWRLDDWDRLAAGTLMGHLLECGMQVTGGYFADPPYKSVPDLAHCGYPLAEIDAEGGLVVTKLAEAGGCVTLHTVKEQLVYEVHDPAAYLTPDVTADFSGVELHQDGRDRVRLSGARGRERPDRLKVTVGFDGGFQGEAGISYSGPGAQGRATLAREILRERITRLHKLSGRLRVDLIGLNSIHATAIERSSDTQDVRVFATYQDLEREAVETALWEVESLLCCGPAGGGGFRGQITPKVITQSAFVARDLIHAQTEVLEA